MGKYIGQRPEFKKLSIPELRALTPPEFEDYVASLKQWLSPGKEPDETHLRALYLALRGNQDDVMDRADLSSYMLETTRRYSTPVRLLAILMGKPTDEAMSTVFVPNMPYYHHRTNKHMDVVCPGYYVDDFTNTPSFDPDQFETFRTYLLEQTGFKYGGGTELFLFTVTHDGQSLHFDSDAVLTLPFELALKEGAIEGYDRFMELVFSASEKGMTPFEFSDKLAGQLAMSGLKDSILELTPKGLQKSLRSAFFFHTKKGK